MDTLSINENINLSTRMHASIYIGVIKEFFKDTWEITFRVPLVIDKLDQYPRAVPLFHHEYELFPNDEVIILVTTQADPTQCYYMPITLYKFMGLKHGVNFVDITKDGIIDLETNNFYSFAIENSEHRTLGKSTVVSNVHQFDANEVIVNIPINPETQQDIIENRSEPVVESTPTGSRTTTINGTETTNVTGTETTNVTGTKTTNVTGTYTILVDGTMSMGTDNGGTFSIKNKNGNFTYGNTTDNIVNEQTTGCIANGYKCLNGKYSLPIYSTIGSDAYSISSIIGYLNFNIVHGLLIGFYTQYGGVGPKYALITTSAYPNDLRGNGPYTVSSTNLSNISSTDKDPWLMNKQFLSGNNELIEFESKSDEIISSTPDNIYDYSFSRGEITDSTSGYSNYCFETTDNLLIKNSDNDSASTYGLTGSFILYFHNRGNSNTRLRGSIRLTTVNGRFISLGYSLGNNSTNLNNVNQSMSLYKHEARGFNIVSAVGSNVLINGNKTLTFGGIVLDNTYAFYSGYNLSNFVLRENGTRHCIQVKNGRLIGIYTEVFTASHDSDWGLGPNKSFIFGTL